MTGAGVRFGAPARSTRKAGGVSLAPARDDGQRHVTVDDCPARFPDDGDFWLLDNRVGLWMVYDQAGELTRIERMTTDEVAQARDIRDRTWNASEPVQNRGEPVSLA